MALATPFTSDQRIDKTGLKKLIEHVTARDGVSYIVVAGSTGEAATLDAQERADLLSFVKEHVNLPIVYGLGGNNTQSVLELIRGTDFTGVTAVLSVCPYYNKPVQEGIFQHYSALADVCPVPLILYNVPGRTGINITAETTLRLARHPNIIGTKESSGNLGQCMEIIKDKPEHFTLISGDDLMTVPMMALGAVGVISVLANAFPQHMRRLVEAAQEGNYAEASRHALRLLPIDKLMYQEGNPVGVKQLLGVLGICSPHVRLPLVSASPALAQAIQAALEVM